MLAEDLAAYFDTTSWFAQSATLDGVTVAGIFDSPYLQAFDGIASAAPSFTLPSTSAASATSASVLVLAGTSYRVRSVQPDGTGISTLVLERQ